VSSDAAIEVGGGEAAGLQTDWTRRLRMQHAASNSSFTLPLDETLPPCQTLCDPHAYTMTGACGHAGYLPSLTPPVKHICHRNIQSATEIVG